MHRTLIVLLLVGCTQSAAPMADLPLLVTPSTARATADMVPSFWSITMDGETQIFGVLDDRLASDPETTIQLVGGERLVAIVGGARTELAETFWETNPEPVRTTRYTASLSIDDPGMIEIDFERADGSVARETWSVPSPFAIASSLPEDVKIGDKVPLAIAPTPGRQESGDWKAWCDATPSTTITDQYGGVTIDATGSGFVQVGDTRYGPTSDCEAQLAIGVGATGSNDPAFVHADDYPGSQPRSARWAHAGTHLWGF